MDPNFNPLTDGLIDLRLAHESCWLWPQLTAEFDRLETVLEQAQALLLPLTTDGIPDWLTQATLGIARSNAAIHQHAELRGSYVAAARSLWTTRIPQQPPTLSDAQILALLAVHETRLAAETFAGLAAGIEEEIEQAGIDHDEGTLINGLRADIAGWERQQWRDAADQMGVAEQFLLMAVFTAQSFSPEALQQAEARLAEFRRRAEAASAVAAVYRQGRQKGAVGRLTRALGVIVREAGSADLENVLGQLREVLGEDIHGIRFDDITDEAIWFTDLPRGTEKSIALDSLRRKLLRYTDK